MLLKDFAATCIDELSEQSISRGNVGEPQLDVGIYGVRWTRPDFGSVACDDLGARIDTGRKERIKFGGIESGFRLTCPPKTLPGIN
jgi:hypothetical protein